MCPCALFDKLFGKKKKKTERKKKEADSGSQNSGSSPNPGESPADNEKKSKKSRRSKRSKQENTGDQSKSQGVESEQKSIKHELKQYQKTYVLLGQPVCSRPHPKNYLRETLISERPDLVRPEDKLDETDLKMLDTHLVMKGEMRGNIEVTLGEITNLDNDEKIGEGDKLTVMSLLAQGRFGAVYMIHKNLNEKEKRLKGSPFMALKTSRRMYCPSRIEYEISMQKLLFSTDKNNGCDGKVPGHITMMIYSGTSAGTSFMVSPMTDANLLKIRQECRGFPKGDSFFVGQEALVGLKECHLRKVVHRDFKPTNLCKEQGTRDWWLCDLGDACMIGEKRQLSYPDNFTLPYMSRAAHKNLVDLVPATIWWDLESWFYFFLEFFIALPWIRLTEEAETLAAKKAFWTNLDEYFQQNSDKLPPQVAQVAYKVAEENPDNIHSKLTQILKIGFDKNIQRPWIPIWDTSARPQAKQKPVVPPPAPKSTAPKSSAPPQKSKAKTEQSSSASVSTVSSGGSKMKKEKSKSKSKKSKKEKSKKDKSKKSRKSKSEQKSSSKM